MELNNDTLGVLRTAQRAHELELLSRLGLMRRPVQLAELFDGRLQPWAVEAAERCLVRGELAGAVDEVVSLTEAGRVALAAPRPTARRNPPARSVTFRA